MQNRIPMNSQSLRKNFPEIYQEIFSRCSIVVSAPRSFTWFGEQAVRYGGMTLRQNIPLRVYAGLIPQKKQEIKITNCLSFDPQTQKFKTTEFDSYQRERIEKYLFEFLKKECGINLTNGFEINILNELPLERGLGSGAIITAIISAILIFCNKIELTNLEKWKNKNFFDLCNDKGLGFDYLFRILWKWENFFYSGVSGSNVINVMPSASPVIFCSTSKASPSQFLSGKQLNLEGLDFVDQNMYLAIKFNEIVKNFSDSSWPFDFGLIYTGEIRELRDSINFTRLLNKKLADEANEFKKDFEPYLKKVEEELLPMAYKICQNKDQIWYGYINSLTINAIRGYLAAKKLISDGFSHDSFKEFIEIINKEQHLFYLLNLNYPKLDALASTMRTVISKHGQEDTAVGTKISGSARRGDILFIADSYHIRNKMEEIINELREKFCPEICLDYASWLDGYDEEGGIKVEQFWQEGIYSSFVPEDSLILTEFKGDEKNTRVITYDKLKKDAYTLLLDTLENKILIKGRALTSKNLPTQAATIQILKALLDSDSRSLSNRNLPSFSYTKYRNEMQGKIVTPLVKLTLGKIKISLDGGLMDFIVKLEIAKSVKIGVLEKITS